MKYNHDRFKWRALIAPGLILLFGLGLRAAYLAEITDSPLHTHPIYDPQYNDYWARGLATGDWRLPEGVTDPLIRSTPHGRPPGYPWFLASIYALFGAGFFPIRLVQMALGLLNTGLLFLLARRFFSRTTALTAAFLFTTCWAFIYFEGILTYPAVLTTLLLLMMISLCAWAASPNLWRALASGLLLGLVSLFRPNALLFAPVLAGWMIWLAARPWQAVHLRRALFHTTLLTLGVLAVLAPPFARNYLVAKDMVFISSYGGLNFYVGAHPESSCVEPRIPELYEWAGIENWCCFDYPKIVRGLAESLGKEDLRFSEANRWFYHAALNNIREQPVRFLRNLGKKTLLFWGPREITNDTTPAWEKHASRTLRYLPGFPVFLALFLCALPGLFQRLRQKPGSGLVLLFIPIYFLSVLPYFVAGRYRMPVLPFLLLFGAPFLADGLAALRQRKLRKLLVGAIAYAMVLGIVSINYLGYEASEATFYIRQGIAATQGGDLDKAVEAYQEALRLQPDAPMLHTNLGRIYERQDKPAEAMAAYQDALKIDPQNEVAHNNLGYLLEGKGDLAAALDHYQRATAQNPQFEIAWKNLAALYMRLNNWPQAEAAWKHLQHIGADNPDIAFQLAQAQVRQDRLADAEASYRAALERFPESALLHNALGYLLQQQGRLDAAKAAYEKALALDPGFTLAANNLGNILLQKGDFKAAEATYRTALTFDPEDRFAHYNLALALEKQQHYEAAIAQYRATLDRYADYAPAWNNLGLLLRQQGQPEEARQALEEAIRLAPDFVAAHVNLGDLHRAEENYPAARQAYEKAQALRPNNDLIQQRLDSLSGSEE